jgi:ABC-type bacteriocin/lantibiotic exporter with double-glycine peptidase domain
MAADQEVALGVLEHFCNASQVAFDRLRARRALDEAERVIPDDDAQAWAKRLVEVAESVDLRVRGLECALIEAVSCVPQRIPVAIYCPGNPSAAEWLLLVEMRGRRIRVIQAGREQAGRWLTARQLARELGLASVDDTVRGVLGQPALPCEAGHGGHHDAAHGVHLSPLTRLIALLRPEFGDMWVILVFSVVVGVLMLAIPIAVEALVNTVAFGRYLQPVVILALVLFVFLHFAATMRALITYVAELIQRRVFVRAVEDLAYRLPRVRREALDQHYAPELVNRFFEVANAQKQIAALLLEVLALILQTMVGMAVLAFYHPFLLGLDVLFLLLVTFAVFGLGRGAVRTAVQESLLKYRVAHWLQEVARHPSAFQLHGGQQFAMERADRLAVDYVEARQKHFRVVMRQVLFSLGLQVIAATVLLGLGGWLVIQGQLTLGQLVAAELIVTTIVGSFAKMGKHMEGFYDLLASMDKLGHLFDLPTEGHDKLFHLNRQAPATLAARDMSYHYGHGAEVLHGVTFELQPGERVALAGPPAGGKSTLIDLACGWRHPTSGHCELDGIDLRELRPDSLREHIGLARHVEIFQGTIDENVHLNRPHISAEDVREALATVGLLDEVLRLPDGLNSQLQTDGPPLSGSQAVRLMLARAIVGRPRLLLIDGVLDALPDDDLPPLLDNLLDPAAPWTLLVASGRAAVLERCQRVLRLDGVICAEQAAVEKTAD